MPSTQSRLARLRKNLGQNVSPGKQRRCRPTLEGLEHRYVLNGMPFQFTLDDPTGAFNAYPLLTANLQAAGQILSQHVGGLGSLEVVVRPDNTQPRAMGGAVANQVVDTDNGLPVLEDGTLYEAQTGVDVNGAEPDIVLLLNTDAYLPTVWFDPNGAERTDPVPGDKTDFISVALHELLHSMGFNGLRATSGAEYGTFSYGAKSVFDRLTAFGTDTTSDVLFFLGGAASAAHGGAVPLTSVGPDSELAGQNFYHVGNPAGRPGDNLLGDVMNGVEFQAGVRYSPSLLDVKILRDLGWGPATTTEFTDPGFVATESSGHATVAVNLSQPSMETVTVDYGTVDGTAVAGSDYTPMVGTLTFAPGETSKSISIPLLDDGFSETDETILVAIANPTGASLGLTAGATVVIPANDTAGISVNPTSGLVTTEGGGKATFQISLTSVPTSEVAVVFSSSNLLEGTVFPSVVTFTAANALTPQTVTVTGVDDNLDDGDINYSVLTTVVTNDPVYSTQDAADVLVLNRDNDPLPIIQFQQAEIPVSEGGGSVTVTVTRSGETSGQVAVNYATSNGTATAGSDYTPASGTLTFAPGQTSQSFVVPILDDSQQESGETVRLTLSNPTQGALLGTVASATIRISDDDASQTQRFVNALYQEILGRGPDTQGQQYWITSLESGAVTRTQMAQVLLASDEYLGRAVDDLYDEFLGRSADTAGRSFWISFLKGGGTLEQISIVLAASDEYFTRSGGSNSSYLSALYSYGLGRDIDVGGLSFWSSVIAQGVPRSAAAVAILSSTEGRGHRVSQIYEDVLGRPADVGGRDFFASLLGLGLREEVISAILLGSDEYFQLV